MTCFFLLFRVQLYSSSGCRQSGKDIPPFLLPLSTSTDSLQLILSTGLSEKGKQTFYLADFFKATNVLVNTAHYLTSWMFGCFYLQVNPSVVPALSLISFQLLLNKAKSKAKSSK